MDEKNVLSTLTELRKNSKPRKFIQTIDLIIALKELDLKKPEEQVEFFTVLPAETGKTNRICALVGGELFEDAKKYADTAIIESEFDAYDKKKIKALADSHEFFLGQANIMPKVAQTFGRILGPRGKMPNPKAGMIIPPKGNIQSVIEKFKKSVKIVAKKSPTIQVAVAKENIDDKKIAKNIVHIYEQLVHHLPKHEHNVKNVYIKFTMSKPVKVSKR